MPSDYAEVPMLAPEQYTAEIEATVRRCIYDLAVPVTSRALFCWLAMTGAPFGAGEWPDIRDISRIIKRGQKTTMAHLELLFAAGYLGAVFPYKFTTICPTVRHAIGKAAGWRCVYCSGTGCQDKGPDGRIWHIDHLMAKANGGDSQPDNLVLACATCNLRKNRLLLTELAGRGVRR